MSEDGSKGHREGHHLSADLSEQRGSSADQVIASSPVLRSWLDEVIVPALVREYIALIQTKDRVLCRRSGHEVSYAAGLDEAEDEP